ncbi:MAG: polysulfide reductase NrfD [Bacteroidetes bacterium]|nr:polysulfide reductase NrfD [Bacteroidota bacterium]MCL5737375.1 polysulfide reductase NrfD [Bacteroidota bacterium]
MEVVDYSKAPPLIEGNPTLGHIDDSIAVPMEKRPSKKYFAALSITLTMLLIGAVALGYTFYYGIGMWGNNIPVGWAFDITNFVFWIGIGHAGTLISAILFLFRQRWRTGIARFAEAMTIFAVMCAGLFPLIHLGRPWYAAFVFPYPNQHGIWINFNSPLVWDVFAVSTYFTVSLMFWYIGLIPDLASMRDRTTNKFKKAVYSVLSLGWRFSNKHWQHYEKTYVILAGLATPLVLSVHSIVSFDFAVSILPGWHTTIFPPYFVAGAIFSGFAMVMTVLIIVRKVFDLEYIITKKHLDKMAKIILVTSMMVAYAYLMEPFIAWYSGNAVDWFVVVSRATGHYAVGFWMMVACNVFIPQLFWFKKIRSSIPALFIISLLVNVGMWLERYIIIVTSLYRDFLPSAWHIYTPTIFDFGILIGSFGLFFTLVLLFSRTLPVISMSEVKGVVEGAHPTHHIGAEHE